MCKWKVSGRETKTIPGSIFIRYLPDNLGIMVGDIDDTKSDIEKVWFNRIGQAPFSAGGKFNVIFIGYIRHGIKAETEIVFPKGAVSGCPTLTRWE